MRIGSLYKIFEDKLKPKLERSIGLNQFANERAKFEGWFKVEVIDILNKKGYNALPEIDRIDVAMMKEKIAIELKVINTNYLKKGKFLSLKDKNRPISKNIQSVLNDIKKLRSKSSFDYKFVMFIVFPVLTDNRYWKKHLEKIDIPIKELRSFDFNFQNKIPGSFYIGEI